MPNFGLACVAISQSRSSYLHRNLPHQFNPSHFPITQRCLPIRCCYFWPSANSNSNSRQSSYLHCNLPHQINPSHFPITQQCLPIPHCYFRPPANSNSIIHEFLVKPSSTKSCFVITGSPPTTSIRINHLSPSSPLTTIGKRKATEFNFQCHPSFTNCQWKVYPLEFLFASI